MCACLLARWRILFDALFPSTSSSILLVDHTAEKRLMGIHPLTQHPHISGSLSMPQSKMTDLLSSSSSRTPKSSSKISLQNSQTTIEGEPSPCLPEICIPFPSVKIFRDTHTSPLHNQSALSIAQNESSTWRRPLRPSTEAWDSMK